MPEPHEAADPSMVGNGPREPAIPLVYYVGYRLTGTIPSLQRHSYQRPRDASMLLAVRMLSWSFQSSIARRARGSSTENGCH